MASVLAAVAIGMFLGLAVRPLLDAYLAFKTARFYAEYMPDEDRRRYEHGQHSDAR